MVFWWWYLKKGVVVSSKLAGRSSEGLVALEELAVSWFVDSDMFCVEKGKRRKGLKNAEDNRGKMADHVTMPMLVSNPVTFVLATLTV